MKPIIAVLCGAFAALTAAQADNLPFYLPADGVYCVGMPAEQTPVVAQPTMVAAAYDAKFTISNTLVAAVQAGGKSYSLQKYIHADTLDLSDFMGVGKATKLLVRDASGRSYQMGAAGAQGGDCVLWAAYNYTGIVGSRFLPLAMYDYWDCPLRYDQDVLLPESDALTVHFSKPGEGLVLNAIDFTLVSDTTDPLAGQSLTCTLSSAGTELESFAIDASKIFACGTKEGHNLYSVYCQFGERVMTEAFDITVSGFSKSGVNAWLPRASLENELYVYPCHTTYANSAGRPVADACVNVMGYYNYIGDWGIPHGKQERGEVITAGDYVQIYYDPSEEGYIDRFQGEVTFPVECTFGQEDIITLSCPDWITTGTDDSQWEEHEAIQLIMQAQALPEGETGRLGKVVFSTLDHASQYTILVIQGAAWFDEEQSLKPTSITNQSGQPLVNASLVNNYEDVSTQVSHIYLHYGEALLKNPATAGDMAYSKSFPNYVTIRNLTKDKTLNLNAYSCGLKAEPGSSEKRIIDIFLSTDSYINTDDREGDYEVTVLEGLATNAEGLPTAAVSFQFHFSAAEESGITQCVVTDGKADGIRLEAGQIMIRANGETYSADGKAKPTNLSLHF